VHSLKNKVDVLVLDDFNAQLSKTSRMIWRECLGPFAIGNVTTANGHRLLQFAQSFGMAIKSTFFKHHPHHLFTWYSPDKVTRTQIDHALIVRQSRIKVLDCRVLRGADFDTDHRLMSVVVRAQFHRSKTRDTQPRTRYDVQSLQIQEVSNAFKESLETGFERDLHPNSTVEDVWDRFKHAIQVAATTHLAPVKSKQAQESWLSQDTQEVLQEKKKCG